MHKVDRKGWPTRRHRTGLGFTLIELMIAVVIFALLAAIAYPNYINHIRKSRRAEAKTLLLEAQSKQERFLTENNVYATSMTTLGYAANPTPTENAWYTVAVTNVVGPPDPSFRLDAIPQNDQTNDTACGTLQIDSFGRQFITGSSTVNRCW
jgi:type IV pilus assembly protein PilE